MSAEEYVGTAGEASWQSVIIEAAGYYGWSVLLNIPDEGLGALGDLIERGRKGKILNFPIRGLLKLLGAISGWPDLTLGHPAQHRLIFIEVKTNDGVVRKNQKEMIALLQSCGQDVYVLRPRNKDALDGILK